jgi:flagellar basal-body rod modification protein FlgD
MPQVSPLTSAANQASGGLRQEDFLRLMLTQLVHQDPLKPQDNAAFVAQMAQFSALAQTQTLNDSMTQLLKIQSSNQSIGLLGKRVTFRNSSNQNSIGVVQSITVKDGLADFSILVNGAQTISGVTLGDIVGVSQATTGNPAP